MNVQNIQHDDHPNNQDLASLLEIISKGLSSFKSVSGSLLFDFTIDTTSSSVIPSLLLKNQYEEILLYP
jgi:hypothetical protein